MKLIILTLALIATVACSPGSESAATNKSAATNNGDNLTAKEVLAKVRVAMDSVESYRFETKSLLLHSPEQKGSGEWVTPDRYHATVRGTEVIVIGSIAFTRPLNKQEWTRVEAPDSQLPPYRDFLQIPDMKEVQFLSSVEDDTYRLEGLVVHEHVESPKSFRTRVTLTVDNQNFRMKEMTRWVLPEARTPWSFCSLEPEAWGEERAQDCPHQSITYFDYDEEIEIRPPEQDG